MTNTPIFDSLVKHQDSIEIDGLAASLWLDDWYHDEGLAQEILKDLD